MANLLAIALGIEVHERAADQAPAIASDQPAVTVPAEGNIPAVGHGVVVPVAPANGHAAAFRDLVLAAPTVGVTPFTACPPATGLGAAARRLAEAATVAGRLLLELEALHALVLFAEAMILVGAAQMVDRLRLGVSTEPSPVFPSQIAHVRWYPLPWPGENGSDQQIVQMQKELADKPETEDGQQDRVERQEYPRDEPQHVRHMICASFSPAHLGFPSFQGICYM
jgi:hypothetical protein